MEFVTDIEKPMLIWVREIISEDPGREARYWPSPLASGFGPSDKRGYHGQVACIQPGTYWTRPEVTVSKGHTTQGGHRGGFFLTIDTHGQGEPPKPPFLLTSLTTLRLVLEQEVSLDPAREWEQLDDDYRPVEHFFLCCPEWVGVLQVDKTKSKRRGQMLVFSDRPEVTIKPGQRLMYTDNTEEEFGSVSPL